jgi:hypothetical protein
MTESKEWGPLQLALRCSLHESNQHWVGTRSHSVVFRFPATAMGRSNQRPCIRAPALASYPEPERVFGLPFLKHLGMAYCGPGRNCLDCEGDLK